MGKDERRSQDSSQSRYGGKGTNRKNQQYEDDFVLKGKVKKDKRSKNKLSKEEQDDLDEYMFLKENPEGEPTCSQCMFFDSLDCPFRREAESFSMPEDFDCDKFYN